jgi:hypothetical protein
MMEMRAHSRDLTTPTFLVMASLVSALIWYLPYGWIAIYPCRMFVTFIHEAGHAVTAILTGGIVERMVIHADGSGETLTRGGLTFFIASAGYLVSSAYGAALLALSRDGHRTRQVLTFNAGVIIAVTFFLTSNLFSWMVGTGLSAGLIWASISATERWAHFLLNLLAVQCCLNAFFDLRTLLWISQTTQLHSDARLLEEMTLLPASVWAIGWGALSLAFWGAGLWNYARFGRR